MNNFPEYPYQIPDLSNLKGEQWEDIPGLDGYYCISNMGRVRRLSFEILCKNGYIRRIGEKILTPELTTQKNHTVNDLNYFLRIKIMQSGFIYNLSIARLVYYSFVKNFDLSNYSLVVIPKDGNGQNIQPKNLILVNLSQKQQRVFERERLVRPQIDVYDEFVNKGQIESSNSNCRQISQYMLNGKLIQTFPSTKVAAQFLGISESGINSVLKGRQVTSGNYVWRYGKEKSVDMDILKKEKVNRFKELRGQKITQYNPDGKRLATYLTISDAARAVGISQGDISSALSGRQKSAGGFIWKKGLGKPEIDLTNYLFGNNLKSQIRKERVNQYSSAGKLISSYASVKDAAAAIGISTAYMSIALHKEKQVKGFFWKKAAKL